MTRNLTFKVTVLFKGKCLKTMHFMLPNCRQCIYFTSSVMCRWCAVARRQLSLLFKWIYTVLKKIDNRKASIYVTLSWRNY